MSEGEFFIQMVWNCPYCNHVNPGLSGEDRGLTCGGCGKKIDQKIEFRMPDDLQNAPVVTDPGLLALAEQKPLWTCGQCAHKNREDMAECGNCGKPRRTERPQAAADPAPPSPAKPNPQPAAQTAKPWTCVGCGTENGKADTVCRLCQSPPGGIATTETSAVWGRDETASTASPGRIELDTPFAIPRGPRSSPFKRGIDAPRVLMGILIAAGAVVLCALFWWAFTPRKTTVTVTAMAWERTRVLERRTATPHQGWGRPNRLLDTVENLQCVSRQHGTESCHPRKCNCRPGPKTCNCTGGGTKNCNPHPEEYCAEPATERKCESQKNGAAKCRDVPTSGCKRKATRTVYDQCPVPQACSQCPEACDTCYDQCPKIEDWCTYDVITWNERDRQTSHGTGRNPHWPALDAHGPDERIDSHEGYVVGFSGPDGHWDKRFGSTAEFLRFDLGKRYAAEYTRAGTLSVLNPLK